MIVCGLYSSSLSIMCMTSLQLEAERRELKERNIAFQALMEDVTGLNDLMKQMAVEVDTQQEEIGQCTPFR